MVESNDLEELVGEEVIMTTSSDKEYAGELESYEDDFSLTLTGDGGPSPDDVYAGDLQYEFVDGSRVFNGANVESVREDDREYRNSDETGGEEQ